MRNNMDLMTLSKQELAFIVSQLFQESSTNKTNITLYEWLDKWLYEYTKSSVKNKTYLTYYYSIKHIKSYLNDNLITEFKEIDFQKALNNMAQNNYAKSTIIKVKILLKRSLGVAVRNHFISQNYAEQLTIPNASVKRVVCLSQEEQEIVEQACHKVLNGELALFLLSTGLRAHEMCNLKWDNYDKDRKQIYIEDSKTKAGIRIVPLVNASNTIINNQPKFNSNIFNTCNKTPLTIQVLKGLYMRLRKRTGIDKITNHVYRHSFATRALERGMNYKALSEILGHTDVAFTLKTYTHVEESYLHSQMKLME